MSPKPFTPSGKSFILSSSEDEDVKDGSADKNRASSSRTRVVNSTAEERKVPEHTDSPQRKPSKAKALGKKPFQNQKKRLIEVDTDRDEASLSSASGSTADRSVVLDTAPKRLTFKTAAQDVLKANAVADKLATDHNAPVIADVSADAASQEKLLKLQAHVINEMFSTAVVRGVERNVLFLSNAQADVCTESPEHMQKLLDQFPMRRKPKMVINLCVSKGFSEHVNSCEHFIPHLFPGLVANNPPFTEQDSESVALERLDRFMADIILPLAVETNALIFCSGISKMCALTSSLTRCSCRVWTEMAWRSAFHPHFHDASPRPFVCVRGRRENAVLARAGRTLQALEESFGPIYICISPSPTLEAQVAEDGVRSR